MNDADHHGAQSGTGREGGGAVPPRPESPPSGPRGEGSSVSASREAYPRWSDTQALPAFDAGTGPAVPPDRPGGGTPGGGGPDGPAGGGARLTGPRRTVGVGTLVAGML
ncbi:MAG TPA: protease Do, partial [Citricoccus sp.]